MGYYKQLDVLNQEKIDRVVRWWKAHEGITPDYLMVLIIEDSRFFEKASEAFESTEQIRAPKPAREHIALQAESKRPRKTKRSWDFSMSHRDGGQVLLWLSLSAALNAVLCIALAVNL